MRFRRWDPLWAVSVHLGHEKAALQLVISYTLCQVPDQAWALPFISGLALDRGYGVVKRGSQHLRHTEMLNYLLNENRL